MAISEEAKAALDALEVHFASNGDVKPGKILHAPSLTVPQRDGTAKGFVFATRDVLVMKLPRLRVDILEGDGTAKRMTMANREMKEWIALPPNDRTLVISLAEEARAYVASV